MATVKQLDDIMECPICTEVYTDPRVLPCVHTYCLKCIREYSKDKQPGDKLACPLCRKEFTLPSSGLNDLPKNFYVANVLEVKKLSSIESKTSLCDACGGCEEGESVVQNVASVSRAVITVVPTKAIASSKTPQSSPLTQSPSLEPASKAVASPKAPIGPFELSPGKVVSLSQVSGQWQANVKESYGPLSREMTLPVLCSGDLSAALRSLHGEEAVYRKRHIHILERAQVPWASRCVYIGELGLKGGGKPDYYVSVADNSDSDDNQVIPHQTTNGIDVTFRPASDGDWYVNTSYHGSSRKIWVMSDYCLSLSANDIRASRWTLWYNRFFTTDHLEIRSSPYTIASYKRQRRNDRYERRQERIRREQRREQERLDAQRRASERRERERQEAIRKEEKRVAEELKRIEKEEKLEEERLAKERAEAEERQRKAKSRRESERLKRKAKRRRQSERRKCKEDAADIDDIASSHEESFDREQSRRERRRERRRSERAQVNSIKRERESRKQALYARQRELRQERDKLQREARDREKRYQRDVEALDRRSRDAQADLAQQRAVDAERDQQHLARARASKKGFWESLWSGVKAVGSAVWKGVKTVGEKVWEGTKAVGKFLWKHRGILTGAALVVGVALVVYATGGVGVLFSEALPGMLLGTHGGTAAAGAWCFTSAISNIIDKGIRFLEDYCHKPYVHPSDQEVAPILRLQLAYTANKEVSSQGVGFRKPASEAAARPAPLPSPRQESASAPQKSSKPAPVREQEERKRNEHKEQEPTPWLQPFEAQAAQEAVEAYLQAWRETPPLERAALRAQGKEILKRIEVLKKDKKQAYRHQVLNFEVCDIDPLAWNKVLQQQKEAKDQLEALRDLRRQLLDACQLHGLELQEADIRTTFDEDEKEEVLSSSDEDTQQLSSEELRDQQALLQEVAIEAGFWIIAPEAKAAQVLLKAGKVLKLGKQIKKGRRMLIQVADSKVGKEATKLVQKMGGRLVEKAGMGAYVLQSRGHTLSNRTLKGLGLTKEQARTAVHALKNHYLLRPDFHGHIFSDGSYVHPHSGHVIDNLFNFVP